MDRTRITNDKINQKISGRKRTSMRYNRYGDDFLIDKIQPKEIGKDMVNVGELVANEEWQIINDSERSLQEDHAMLERETDLEQSETERRENTNLRILEWMYNLEVDEKGAQSIQHVDVSATKHIKTENPLFGWTATDRPLDKPPDNLNQVRSTGTSSKIFVREAGVGLTHTENLKIKKLRELRETNSLELNQEGAEPAIGRNCKTKFEIPSKYSESILIIDSDFILSDKTSAICITAYMSFKTRLEADFKKEYQSVEFLFRQRPGLGGMAAPPPSVSQFRGKKPLLFGDESQWEKHDRPRACDIGITTVEELPGRKRDTRGFSAGLRPEPGQIEP